MAERLAYLEAVVGADITQFRKGMRDIRNETGLLSETMSGIAGLGRTLTFAITTPLVALGSFAVQEASEFDAALRNINSIAQMSEATFASFSEEVFDFAKTTRAGVVPATEALYEIFSAGVADQATAMAIWETSNRVAEAGLADLTKTTNAVTATIAAYGMEAEDAAAAGDVWAQMVALGVGSMEDFLANSQKVLPLSSALGISFEDLGATVAYLSQQGGGAKKAMTALAMMESNLLKPTESLKEAFDKLGVTTGEELIAKFGTVTESIIAIHGAADDPIDFASMFSKTGLEAALSIINNMDSARASVEDFSATVEGATDRQRQEQMKSFSYQFDLMKAAIGGVNIAIGEKLMPMLTPLVQEITKVALAVSDLDPAVMSMGIAFAGAVALGAPLLWLLGSILTPAGLLLGAVSALGAAFATNFGGIRDTVNQTISDITGDLSGMSSIVTDVMDILFPPSEPDLPTIISNEIKSYEPIELAASEFVTVKAGDTLWSIWADNYSDRFSWDEFKTEIGWTPHLLQIGEVIEISGSFGSDLEEMMRHGFMGNVSTSGGLGASVVEIMRMNNSISNPIADSMSERIGAAIDLVVARLPAELMQLANSAITWFDNNAGMLLDNIAMLFEPSAEGGDSPVYRSFTAILEGDIGRAIDEIIPGLGTRVSSAIGNWNLADAFPKLTAALSNLLGRVGTWILTDGIPIISRSVGYLAGTLGVEFTRAIESAMAFLTNPATGDAAANAAAYAQTGILDPFTEGFSDAIAGTSFEGVLTTLTDGLTLAFSGLESAFNLLNIDNTIQGLKDIGEGLSSFMGSIASADFSGIGKLLALGAAIFGFFWSAGNIITGEIASAIGESLESFGYSIRDFVNAISALMNGDIGGFLTNIGSGFVNLAVGLLRIPMGVFDGIIVLFRDLLNLDISTFSEVIDEIEETLKPKDVYADVTDAVANGGLLTSYQAGLEQLGVNLEGSFKSGLNVERWLQDRFKDIDPTGEMFKIMNQNNQTMPMVLKVEEILLEHPDWINDPAKVFAALGFPTEATQVWTPTVVVEPSLLTDGAMLGSGMLMPEGLLGQTIPMSDIMTLSDTETFAMDAANKAFDAEKWRVEAEEAGAGAVDALAAVITDSVANGTLDPVAIQDGFITPLTTAWTAAFGEGGALRADFTGFMLNILMNTTAVGASFVTMGIVSLGAMMTLQKGLDPVVTAIIQMLDNIVQTANDAAGAIQSVVDGFNMNKDILLMPVQTAPAIPGVPMGATPTTPMGIPSQSTNIAPTGTLFTQERNAPVNNNGGNTINIYGATDIEDVEYRLRRKGIEIQR